MSGIRRYSPVSEELSFTLQFSKEIEKEMSSTHYICPTPLNCKKGLESTYTLYIMNSSNICHFQAERRRHK